MNGIQVAVSDPKIEKEGRRDQTTTYLVTTGDPARPLTSVRRRYSDFTWLYGRLQTELPGAIVPIIPHQMALGKKFDPHFVETRRRHLHSFMQHIVAHEEMQRAPSMTPFMMDKLGDEFEHGKKKVEAKNPTSLVSPDEDPSTTVKKVSNMFAKAGTLMRVRAGKKDLTKTPEEEKIEEMQNYIAMVEAQVKTLVQSAQGMTSCTREMAKIVQGMHEPILEWKSGYQQAAKMSDEIGDMMSALVEFTNDYGQLLDHKYIEEQLEFEDVMLRLGNDVKAFKVALKQRKYWQVTVTTRRDQITAKEEQFSKATFNLKPPEVTGRLSTDRAELQRLAELEQKKLDECTKRFLKEATKSKTRLESQLRDAFRGYGKIQIAYTNRINEAWGELMPYVGGDVKEENDEEKKENEEDNNENCDAKTEDTASSSTSTEKPAEE